MGRIEAFLPDGKRIHVAPSEVVSAWRACTRLIPAQYAVGTGDHESSFTVNEVDTEASGFISKGIFQLSDEEIAQSGQCADVLTLGGSCSVLSNLAEKRLLLIMHAAEIEEPTPDCWAYLAIAHNQGPTAAVKTIQKYGLNWVAYRERNRSIPGIASYGDDCITGGIHWPTQS